MNMQKNDVGLGQRRADAHNAALPIPAPCQEFSLSRIDIRHPHSLPAEQARTAIEDVARKLGERFDMASRWDGEVLHFSRSGVDGAIELLPGQVRVTAELGFLLSAMKGMVESEIQRVLADKLG